MLYKNELKDIPFSPMPKLKKSELKKSTYVAAVSITDLEKSGRVLAVDIYSLTDKAIKYRFFADGSSFWIYSCATAEWNRKTLFKYMALRYLDGNRGTAADISGILDEFKKDRDCNTLELDYFNVIFYKKGTAHITFKDMELLDKFNLYGSQRKGWLPPSYGKKRYNDMTKDEQKVIDGFQGKAEYEKVLLNKDFYMVEPSLPLLASAV